MGWAGGRWRDGGRRVREAGRCLRRDGLVGCSGWGRCWWEGGGVLAAFGFVLSFRGEFFIVEFGGRLWEIGVAGGGLKDGDA